MKKEVYSIVLTLSVLNAFVWAFSIQLAKASGTIYIRANGSIEGTTNIVSSDNITYTFTANINDSIVIQKNDIILNGNGYTLEGHGSGNGIYLYNIHNVAIRNLNIKHFSYGICLNSSSYGTISKNNLADNNDTGILVYYSSNNAIYGNNLTSEGITGIHLWSSLNNTVSQNRISNVTKIDGQGIGLSYSSSSNVISKNEMKYLGQFEGQFFGYGVAFMSCSGNNSIVSGNHITNCGCGIVLVSSTGSKIICENDIENNRRGIYPLLSSSNIIYHNNFLNNIEQTYSYSSTNTWDDGYPYGGNFWSNYNGSDHYRGSSQNETGSDGIGDTDYIVSVGNADNYPLMGRFGHSTMTGGNVTVFPTEDVCLIFENVTEAGSTTVQRMEAAPAPPPGETFIVPCYNITTTANHSGKATIRIIYDDSGMTGEEETSLHLLHWNTTGARAEGDVQETSFGFIDMKDISYLAKRFGTFPGHQLWDPYADINDDGVIDMKDIAKAAKNFGITLQMWMAITTYLDTVSNVIYGETEHFSMFGIT